MRVKANYILAQIADKEGIKVKEQELSRQISAMAMQQKIKPQKLADQLKENGGIYEVQEEILNALKYQLSKSHPNKPRYAVRLLLFRLLTTSQTELDLCIHYKCIDTYSRSK